MKAEIKGTRIELEPNSKPFLLKRIFADGFDIILIFVLFLLFTTLILKTPLANTFQAHLERYQAIEKAVAQELQNDADAISRALNANDEYQEEWFAANVHSYLLKAAACFLAELLVLLAVPLLNGRRATPGKLMTGLVPFNEKRQCQATVPQTICRFLFVLLFDSLSLYLYTGILTFFLVPVLRLTEMLLNKDKNKTLCDFVTGVMVIEGLSYDGV